MTKQEEIRDRMVGMELGRESEGALSYRLSTEDVDKIFTRLASEGGAIKVDRELPDWLEYADFDYRVGYLDCWKHSGLVAVEPIIEEA